MQVANVLNARTNTWIPAVLPDFKENINYDENGTFLESGNYALYPSKQLLLMVLSKSKHPYSEELPFIIIEHMHCLIK
jgi:hypothetical protein